MMRPRARDGLDRRLAGGVVVGVVDVVVVGVVVGVVPGVVVGVVPGVVVGVVPGVVVGVVPGVVDGVRARGRLRSAASDAAVAALRPSSRRLPASGAAIATAATMATTSARL